MASAIVLAGGRSIRMGRDKASLMLDGKPLLQHVLDAVAPLVSEIVVVTRPGQSLMAITTPVRVVQDVYPGRGPLAGLYSGLLTASSFPALTVACDMPLLQPNLLRYLLRASPGYDAVVPSRDGLPEPLCAAYGANCLAAVKACIDSGVLKMTAFLPGVRTWYATEEEWRQADPEGLSFFNVNTREDLDRAYAYLSNGHTPSPAVDQEPGERA